METSLLLALLLGVLAVLVTVAAIIQAKKKRQTKGITTKLIGIRPGVPRAIIRDVVFIEGRYTWEEGDHLRIDVYSDPNFIIPTPTGPLLMVDLDTGHPIRYLGQCTNDDKSVKILHADGTAMDTPSPDAVVYKPDGTKATLKQTWMRLGGQRLYNIRHSIKIQQMTQVIAPWYQALLKFVPVVVALSFILLLLMAFKMFS